MKVISVVNSDRYFDDNYMFRQSDVNDLLYPFWYLKKRLKEFDVSIYTSDTFAKEKADFIIYNEAPKKGLFGSRDLPEGPEISKSYLLSLECPIIRPANYDLRIHSRFNKIFTWDDELVQSNPLKYIKNNFVQKIRDVNKQNQDRSGFLVCISGNKKVNATSELYSQRLEIIKWMSIHHPDMFDLYGSGWGHHKLPSDTWYRPVNRLLRCLPANQALQPRWQGRAGVKTDVLATYKFNLCFENAQGYPGYITEKIFDSFFSGCIPIYWGAPNIAKFIPEECYIDYSQFSDFEDCFKFLKSLSNQQIEDYQEAQQMFLDSDDSFQFSVESKVKTFISALGL
jgi:hypothetical protein